jgi:hypothetical protein
MDRFPMGGCSSRRPDMLRTAMAEQKHLPRTGLAIGIIMPGPR